MSHGTLLNESCNTCKQGLCKFQEQKVSHGTLMDEACDPYKKGLYTFQENK